MRNILIIILLCLFSTQNFSQKVLTLNDAIKIAFQKNTTLQKSENSLQVYESNLKTSYGGLFPSLSASGDWNWSRTEDRSTPLSYDYETRSYSVGLNSGWTLFDGLSTFTNISRNEKNLEAAKLDLLRLKQDIVFQTISSYYDILNAKKQVKVKEDNLKWNQKNYEIIVERNRLGSVTLADVYSQQVKLGSAELELIKATNDFETLKSQFLYQLGLDVFEKYTFEDASVEDFKTSVQKENLKDLKESVEIALQNRSDYKSLQLGLETSMDNISIAKSGHLPTLSLSSGLSFGSNTIKTMFDKKRYSLNLGLNIPIFSGFIVDNKIQLAEVDAKNKKIQLDDFEREVKKDLQKNYLDLETSGKKLEVSHQNVKAAEENRRIEEEKYALGSTTLLNVLIANSDYTSALSLEINSHFDYLKLKEQLKYYLGILNSTY